MVIVTILALIYYIMMFISAIRLRYTQPNKKRYYKVPFGNFGMWVLVILGMMSALFGIGIALVPPSQVAIGSVFVFESAIVSGLVVFIGIGLLIFALRKPEWVVKVT